MNEEEEKKFIEIVETLKALRISKSHDYGTSWKIYGLEGILWQIRSKFIRLINLTTKGKDPKHESLRDTLIDMANYSLMGVQLIDMGMTEDSINKLLEIDNSKGFVITEKNIHKTIKNLKRAINKK